MKKVIVKVAVIVSIFLTMKGIASPDLDTKKYIKYKEYELVNSMTVLNDTNVINISSELIKINPKDSSYYHYMKGICYISLGNYQEGLNLLNNTNYNSIVKDYYIGRALIELNELELAKEKLNSYKTNLIENRIDIKYVNSNGNIHLEKSIKHIDLLLSSF